MIGRIRELARMVEATRHGAGSALVLLAGEDGLGKSTLVEALAAGFQGQVTIGRAQPFAATGLVHAAIAGVLKQLARQVASADLRRWAGANAPALAALLPELGEPVHDRLRLFEAVTAVLEGAAAREPLLVVIEDAQWIDESSSHLIRFLHTSLGAAAVTLLVTFRAKELSLRPELSVWLAELQRLPATHRIDLAPLGLTETTVLIRSLAPQLSPAAGRRLAERSGGVPFFAAELARTAPEGTEILPATLRDALLLRLAPLSGDTREVLVAAAIGGHRVDDAVLRRVVPGAIDDALAEATADVLIPDATGYAYRHALLRECVLETVLPGERQRWHLAYVDALASAPPSADLVRHLCACHREADALAAAVTLAGDEGTGDPEGLRLYEEAFQLMERVPDAAARHDRGDLFFRAAERAITAGEPERGLALIDRSLAMGCTPLARAARLTVRGRILGTMMDASCRDVLADAVALTAGAGAGAERAVALEALAHEDFLADDTDACAVHATEARDLARSLGLADLATSAELTLAALPLVSGAGRTGLTALARLKDRCLAADLQTRNSWYLHMSEALQLMGRHQQARDVVSEGMSAVRAWGVERSGGAMLAGNAADISLFLGDWDHARDLADAILALAPSVHYYRYLLLARARIAQWCGDAGGAESWLTEIRESELAPPGQGWAHYRAMVTIAEVGLALSGGPTDRVWTLVQETLRTPHAYRCWQVLASAAAIAAERRRRGEPVDWGFIDRVIASTPQVEIAPFWCAWIEAERMDTLDGWRAFRAAVDDNPGAIAFAKAYSDLRLGAALLAAGDLWAARRTLAAARIEAESIGLAFIAGGAIRRLRELGHADPSPTDALTPREEQVLALVAQGHSNGQIAAALSMSTKTASSHVSHILAKLGVRSRGEAAAHYWRNARA